jgi:hypothetical protein
MSTKSSIRYELDDASKVVPRPNSIRPRYHRALTVKNEQASTTRARAESCENEGRSHLGDGQDVSSLIVELLNKDFIAGENVVIDGGMTMRTV